MKKLLLRRATEEDTLMADPPPYSTPLWVKVVGIFCIVLVVLAGIALFRGEPDLDRLMQPTPTIEQVGQQP